MKKSFFRNHHLESGAAHDASALAVNQGGEADGVLAGAVGGPHDGRDDVVERVDLVVVNHCAVMLERNGVERTLFRFRLQSLLCVRRT